VDRSGDDGEARRWELGDVRLLAGVVLRLESADHVHGDPLAR